MQKVSVQRVEALEGLLTSASAQLHTIEEVQYAALISRVESIINEAVVVLAEPHAKRVGASALASSAMKMVADANNERRTLLGDAAPSASVPVETIETLDEKGGPQADAEAEPPSEKVIWLRLSAAPGYIPGKHILRARIRSVDELDVDRPHDGPSAAAAPVASILKQTTAAAPAAVLRGPSILGPSSAIVPPSLAVQASTTVDADGMARVSLAPAATTSESTSSQAYTGTYPVVRLRLSAAPGYIPGKHILRARIRSVDELDVDRPHDGPSVAAAPVASILKQTTAAAPAAVAYTGADLLLQRPPFFAAPTEDVTTPAPTEVAAPAAILRGLSILGPSISVAPAQSVAPAPPAQSVAPAPAAQSVAPVPAAQSVQVVAKTGVGTDGVVRVGFDVGASGELSSSSQPTGASPLRIPALTDPPPMRSHIGVRRPIDIIGPDSPIFTPRADLAVRNAPYVAAAGPMPGSVPEQPPAAAAAPSALVVSQRYEWWRHVDGGCCGRRANKPPPPGEAFATPMLMHLLGRYQQWVTPKPPT